MSAMPFLIRKKAGRDGDGDGFVNDGKPSQRPVQPGDIVGRGKNKRIAGGGGKKGGTGRTAADFVSRVTGAPSPEKKKADGTPDKSKKPWSTGQVLEEIRSKPKPTKVTSAEEALKRLAAGEHIEMDKETVAVFLDKLSAIGKAAFEKGESTPDYDLCRVHVPDTNIFCADNKGIIRKKMPQLGGKNIRPGSKAAAKLKAQGGKDGDEVKADEEFLDFLDKQGIKVSKTKHDASKLKATQSQLVGGQVGGMMAASTVKGGKLDLSAPIYVSRDGFILDGHHRWASLAALEFTEGKTLQMNTIEIDMPILDLLDLTNAFTNEFGILPKDGGGVKGVKKSDTIVLAKRKGKARGGPNLKSSPKEIVGSHGHKSHGKSILWPALYEHLIADGKTKSVAAAISNGQWRKKRGLPPKSIPGTKGKVPIGKELPCLGCGDEPEEPRFEIEKIEPGDEKQMVFGWAYVAHDGIEQVVDKSGEFIDEHDELEAAAYNFVLHSRNGGQDHARGLDGPVVKSTLVESIVFTPEKIAKMGLPEGSLPTGWWTGFRVNDPDLWAAVKRGEYTSFSVHGTGVRTAVEDER